MILTTILFHGFVVSKQKCYHIHGHLESKFKLKMSRLMLPGCPSPVLFRQSIKSYCCFVNIILFLASETSIAKHCNEDKPFSDLEGHHIMIATGWNIHDMIWFRPGSRIYKCKVADTILYCGLILDSHENMWSPISTCISHHGFMTWAESGHHRVEKDMDA